MTKTPDDWCNELYDILEPCGVDIELIEAFKVEGFICQIQREAKREVAAPIIEILTRFYKAQSDFLHAINIRNYEERMRDFTKTLSEYVELLKQAQSADGEESDGDK